jgi:hypothetical protein
MTMANDEELKKQDIKKLEAAHAELLLIASGRRTIDFHPAEMVTFDDAFRVVDYCGTLPARWSGMPRAVDAQTRSYHPNRAAAVRYVADQIAARRGLFETEANPDERTRLLNEIKELSQIIAQ